VNAVFLAVAERIELDPSPRAGIDGLAIGGEINRNLHEAPVVFETDIAPHTNGRSARYRLAHHRPIGDATHHLVGEQLPAAADRREGRLTAQIVDDGRLLTHGLASR